MTAAEVLKELERLGTAQNRKVYARHGIGPDQFGVSFANLNKLRKQIKRDHALALALWASGNHDARVLATMIADPAEMSSRTLEAWVKDLDSYVITDAFMHLAGAAPTAQAKMEKWIKSKQEWIARAGWLQLSFLAMHDAELPDKFFAAYLPIIEKNIHQSQNRVKDAMNMAAITIGLRSDALCKKTLASAKRIGTVEVDHGATSCKTPDIAEYIKKTLARKKQPARK